MAIDLSVGLLAHQLWPQGDIRDPLGVWGSRQIVVGDASGGSIKVATEAPVTIAGAFLYTCYSAVVVISDAGQVSTQPIKLRLLTNWPDVGAPAGVQGYGSMIVVPMNGDAQFTGPSVGPSQPLIQPADRFILLFDPRPVAGAFNILELEFGLNTDGLSHTFEAWGYYWDRSVLQAPGGPRHPGSN